jgi:hypothetical protein
MIPAGMLVLGLVVGVGGVVLLGGGDGKSSITSITSTTGVSTTLAPADGSSSTSGGSGSGSGAGSGTRSGRVPARTQPAESPAPTTPAKPAFTFASAEPKEILCAPGASYDIKISWRTTGDVTGVSVDRYDGAPNDSYDTSWFCGTGQGTRSETLIAWGPSKDVKATVSWHWKNP